jgi:hypothetical protein
MKWQVENEQCTTMPINSYHCKYCHQRKSTETALNRHVAHSAQCFKAWQDDLRRLTSTNIGTDGRIERHSATMDDLIPPDFLANESNVEELGPVTSFSRSGETDVDDIDDIESARSESRYRRGYDDVYPVEILGTGQTKFQLLQEQQRLRSESDWAPFNNQKEWDLAQWLIKNVGQKSIDEFLKLPIVSTVTHSEQIY